MKRKLFTYCFFMLTMFWPQNWLFSQTRTIDSLLVLLSKDKADTVQVLHLLQLCREYRKAGIHDKGLKYSNKAILVSSSIKVGMQTGWLKGISTAYTYKGNIYLDLSNYSEALTNYHSGLKIAKINKDKNTIAEINNQIATIYYYLSNYAEALNYYTIALETSLEANNKKITADACNNIGNVYYLQGDYEAALKNYIVSLNIGKQINNKDIEASAYINIGNIYQLQNNSSDALANFREALKIRIEQKEKYGVANCYNNIGYIYFSKNDFTSALQNYNLALKIAEDINNVQLVAISALNMGNVYATQGNYSAALVNFSRTADIYEKVENKFGLATAYINISDVLGKENKTEEARKYILLALDISKAIGSKELIQNSYYSLSISDSTMGKWNEAYQHHKLYLLYKDSINNEESRKKTLQATMTFEFKKREAQTKAEQEKKDAVEAAEREKQQLVLLLISFVLILLLVFVFFIFRSLKSARQQKFIIQEKNKDIIDSINYAKHIQDALLRNEEHISEKLHKHFVMFKPKDIVSGDFYWSIEKQEHWYFAVADCTGHGVPGGFMSMLGIAFLNEITATEQLLSPAQILEQLRAKIVKELGQDEKESQSKDGMDISLIRLNLKTNELQWAGANTPLFYIQNGELSVLKADKQPIGYYTNMKAFTNHTLNKTAGTTIYLHTDGYADQFGGDKGKKFMQKNLKELLLKIHSKPLEEQKEILTSTFEKWKSQLAQVDDVCIAGIKI